MTFKCKMCGGDIQIIKGTNTGKCLYCKSVMTLPNTDNEKILNLYNRASELRQSNEFDKAQGLYESILSLDNTQIEAKWGILLCKYGVEYVDDPNTGKKIPTCHKASHESILATEEYKYIINKAYGDTLKLYKNEAKEINRLQKEILTISENEKPYDIFICYKETDEKNGGRTKDSVLAQEIYNELTKLNYNVFFSRITLEDKIGSEYEPYIFSALNSAKIMLVVGTSKNNMNSPWVKNEWNRYIDIIKKDQTKTLIPCFYGMSASDLPDEFSLLQGQDLNKIGAIQDLVRGITKLLPKNSQNKQISDDLLSQVKEILKEEEAEKKRQAELEKAGIPVKIYKDKCPKYYIVINLMISLFIAAFYIILISQRFFVSNILSTSSQLINNVILVFGITAILYLVAFILGITNRKNQKISKYIYILNMIMFIIFSVYIYNKYNLIFSKAIIGVYLGTILLLFLKSKWEIKTIVQKVPKSYAEEIQKYNEAEKQKLEKTKPTKIIVYIVGALLALFLIISAIIIKPDEILNQRNENMDQIQIINNYINIRQKPSNKSERIGQAKEGQYYTVLETINCSKEVKCPNFSGAWYKIQYTNDITGYIYSGGNYEYISYIPKNANN